MNTIFIKLPSNKIQGQMQDFFLISSLFVNSDAVPEYVLNLDLDPVDRWTQIATEKRNEVIILQFIKLFSHMNSFSIYEK